MENISFILMLLICGIVHVTFAGTTGTATPTATPLPESTTTIEDAKGYCSKEYRKVTVNDKSYGIYVCEGGCHSEVFTIKTSTETTVTKNCDCCIATYKNGTYEWKEVQDDGQTTTIEYRDIKACSCGDCNSIP